MAFRDRLKKLRNDIAFQAEVRSYQLKQKFKREDKSEEDEKDSEKKKKKSSFKGFVIAVIALAIEWMIFVSIWGLLLTKYQDQLAPLIDAIVNFLKLLGPIGQYATQLVIPVIILTSFLMGGIILLARGYSLGDIKALVENWALAMLFYDIALVAGYFILISVPPDVILQLKCYITSPGAQCGVQEQPEAPDVKKLGVYDVADVKLGRSPKYEILPIYKDQVYTLKATVVNKNPEKPLEDLYFVGFLDNGTCSETGDTNKCTQLAPSDYCSEQEKCEVTESKSVTLDSVEPVSYKSSFAEVNVRVYYSYSVTGEQKFWIYRNEDEGTKFVYEKPTSSDGPIDVAIEFTPDYQFLGAKADKVKVLIYIENKGDGIAYVESIKVKRSSELNALEFSECKTSWDKTFSEDEEFDLGSKVLQKEFLFICNYKLSPDYSFDDKYKTTAFDVDVNYRYRMSTEPKVTSITKIPD